MAEDIVTRLRSCKLIRLTTGGGGEETSSPLHVEAADRIEALEAALREIKDCCTLPAQNDSEMREIAHKALERGDD